MFDLDLMNFLGRMFGSFNNWGGPARSIRNEERMVSFLISSLNSPVYVALPVQDEKVVDDFLNQLDKVLVVLARQRENFTRWIRLEQDFYKGPLGKDARMHGYGFSIGPVKWRFFWARIGKGLYVASKSFSSCRTCWTPRPPAPGARRSRRAPTSRPTGMPSRPLLVSGRGRGGVAFFFVG